MNGTNIIILLTLRYNNKYNNTMPNQLSQNIKTHWEENADISERDRMLFDIVFLTHNPDVAHEKFHTFLPQAYDEEYRQLID